MKQFAWLALFGLIVAGCGKKEEDPAPKVGSEENGVDDLGLKEGYTAGLVMRRLNNPSCVTFRQDGALTIFDSGNGRIIIREGERSPQNFATEFDTEHWKIDTAKDEKRFKLGPLSGVWVTEELLAVVDGGKPNGEETILFFKGPGTADTAAESTNGVEPTTDDPKDTGEGNMTGLAATPDGKTIYVCGQGSDQKTWLLVCDVESKSLEPFASADDAGIAINSPMQARVKDNGNILVLYSGAGGEEDGLIAEWDPKGKLVAKWELPGLIDPMGMDFLPGSQDTLAVVDNNWSLTEVKDGRLAVVTLPEGKAAAKVEIIGTKLKGPVSCEFGPEDKLYITQLGPMFDQNKGNVIAIHGFQKK